MFAFVQRNYTQLSTTQHRRNRLRYMLLSRSHNVVSMYRSTCINKIYKCYIIFIDYLHRWIGVAVNANVKCVLLFFILFMNVLNSYVEMSVIQLNFATANASQCFRQLPLQCVFLFKCTICKQNAELLTDLLAHYSRSFVQFFFLTKKFVERFFRPLNIRLLCVRLIDSNQIQKNTLHCVCLKIPTTTDLPSLVDLIVFLKHSLDLLTFIFAQ